MEAMPMTPSGKAQKFILRERAAEALALGPQVKGGGQ
jgi:acyl-coenzyme A synthetase/AMP-(fatty) acid ligase